MTCTTWFVTGSMMCTLSPAEFVWTIRTLPDCAAAGATVASGNKRVRANRRFIATSGVHDNLTPKYDLVPSAVHTPIAHHSDEERGAAGDIRWHRHP